MKWFFIILFSIFMFVSKSQNWEVGITTGFANYQGDLAPDIELAESNYMFGLFVKRNFNPYYSISLGINQGSISGNDNNFSFLKERNLSFRSEIVEVSSIFEFNFLPFSLGINPNRFSPYTFIGFGVFTHEPVAILNNKEIKLRYVDTEGKLINSGDETYYSRYQVCIPMGGGFKIKLNDRYNLGINVGFRYSYTDYLDDVSTTYYDPEVLENTYGTETVLLSDRSASGYGIHGKQRGRSDQNDWYIFSGITLSYKFKNNPCPFY